MDQHTLYAHILRDITFINLIFKQNHVNDETIQTIKTRVAELVDMSMTSTFKHFPHVIRELAANKIYILDKAWQSIETTEDFEEQRNELEKETSFLLKKVQENKFLMNAA